MLNAISNMVSRFDVSANRDEVLRRIIYDPTVINNIMQHIRFSKDAIVK
jgi:hypothetical protein